MGKETIKIEYNKPMETTVEEMSKQVLKGTDSDMQMSRTELAFYMELFEQIKALNEKIETLSRIETIVHHKEIQEALGKPKASNCVGEN